jgi:hypothetical protein
LTVKNRVLAGFCAFFLYAPVPGRAASEPRNPLRVSVDLMFDASVTKVVRTLVKQEAAAIWKTHDVELEFRGADGAAAVHLDAFIAADQPDPRFHRRPPVLGQTVMEGVTRGSIHISLDNVESTLECRHLKLLWLYEHDLGMAAGRVLAHEIGHALLGGPPFHDTTGLMRANFTADDLTNLDPRLFRLSNESEARLRVRNTALLNEPSRAQPRVGSPD